MPTDKVPEVQRALIFQGGGALAAYEAGVFSAFCEYLLKKDMKYKNNGNRHLFDIVAGTSSGSFNAAIIASYVMEKGTWNGCQLQLESFWNYISTDTKEYFPTKNALEKFAKFPIATRFDQNQPQPRLLLIGVDVQESAVVTFDSYPKKDNSNIRESRYGKYSYEGECYEYTISYPDGITLDHAMASCWIPVNYDYAKISDVQKLNKYNTTFKVERNFWDGGILSNSPLRELIHWHRDYGFRVKGKNQDNSLIPNLDVYITDIRSTQLEIMPLGRYGILNNQENLILNDRTDYDIKVTEMVSDYAKLSEKFIDLAKEYHIPNEKIEKILSHAIKSQQRSGKTMTYKDLIDKRFDINVIRIKPREKDTGFLKSPLDFSSKNILRSIHEGRKDAMIKMLNMSRI